MRFQNDPIWRHLGSPNYHDHDHNGFINACKLEDANTLVTGSSHVYGTNLRKYDTWPVQLQSAGCNIYSAAMGAWSLMQFALVARTYLRPCIDRFFVYIYLGFDIYATLKHTIDTRESSPFGYFDTSDLSLGLDWSYRNKRDICIKNSNEKGMIGYDGLHAAHAAGCKDCYPVYFDDTCWFIEPQLRTLTTSLDTPYMIRALELANIYIHDILEVCRLHAVQLKFVFIPTKESVIAANLTNSGSLDLTLSRVLDSERELALRLHKFIAGEGGHSSDLFDFYKSMPAQSIFNLTPFEGHPHASGAKLLACHMREWFASN
jgi:hypothetical protein